MSSWNILFYLLTTSNCISARVHAPIYSQQVVKIYLVLWFINREIPTFSNVSVKGAAMDEFQEYPTNRSSKITALHPFYPWLAFLHNNPFTCWFSRNIYLFAGWLCSNSRRCWENYFISDPGKTIQTNRAHYWDTGETQFSSSDKIISIFPPTDFC